MRSKRLKRVIALLLTITMVVASKTYCFDLKGNMVTGWVQTPDSK